MPEIRHIPNNPCVGEVRGMLSAGELRTLQAICAALAPAQGGDDPEVARLAASLLAEAASADEQRRIRRALGCFESRFLNLFLTGRFRRLTGMDSAGRERLLRAWAGSRLGLLRAGFQAFKRLILFLAYSRPDPQTGVNIAWPAIGYPGPLPPSSDTERPISPLIITQDSVLDADVVVIGSGAGGGVVAAELAAAGRQVIVLEKGGYFAEPDFDGAELTSVRRLFEKQGLLATRDAGVMGLAGSTLGGGTTINWMTCLRTPEAVLRQWEHECGIAGAAGPEWQSSLDAVCDRIHVTTDESLPNRHNQKLIDGCTALGYHWRVLPRNARGCHDCGSCGFGCRHGAKQGTLKTYLQDAFDQGARIIPGCHADRVTIQAGRVTGLEATVNGRRLTVRSPLVVAAGGSIHTPALLLLSALANPNIGRNLFLHPTAAVFGIYPDPVEAWRGTMQTAACDQFMDLEPGYGFIIEVAPVYPGLLACGLPWHSAQGHRKLMSQAAHVASFIAITRDRHGGTVRLDRQGRPVLDYTVSASDAPRLLRGAQEAVRLHAAAGAHTIGGPYNNLPEIAPGHEDVEAHVHRFMRRGVVKNDLVVFSAHQMSSCRMGGHPARAAVKPDGETYEVKNLYVADASALPTSTGVNPMVSIMALAHRTAQFIKARK
jgi:choline dehydrogenase-like flavoprotein